MNIDNVNRTADQLADLAGGYNRTTLFGGVAASFLGGSFLGALFGWLFFVLLLVIALIIGGVVGYMMFRSAGGAVVLPGRGPAQPSSASPEPPPPAPPPPSAVHQQAAAPPPPAAPAVELSDLERAVMERLVQSDGNLSISALAGELGVSGETIQETVEGLANRGFIALG